MAYCTQDDVLNLISERDLIQLTDDANTGLVDTDIVDSAIAAADGKINYYCSSVYTTPFTTPPDIVKAWSVDIAIYDLYSRRSDVAMPEIRKSRYDAALEQLAKIQSGAITLDGILVDVVSTDTTGVLCSTSRDDRIFTITRAGVAGTLDNY